MHLMCQNVYLSTGNLTFVLSTLKLCTEMFSMVENIRLVSQNVTAEYKETLQFGLSLR